MNAIDRRSVRCAIYTRKSSEEGLEQSFNSLDAQREACLAYVQSQRQEGWRALPTHYDDGGFSGGNMERPALRQLLADIEARKVDTVVVYKVDRLTRSLADFAKIIEAFDARGVSFVSVTQQFNTTSSMGRLTLNVLLSFAQFEREVTGERIRDKIAASKRKGMWMGGCIPLGYDPKDRRLVINEREAEQVREIYRLYLKFGCVKKLKSHLDAMGMRSKIRVSKMGNRTGGAAYSRGALYKILSNRTYLGEVPHKDQSFPGEHEAIIDRKTWEKVRARMAESIRGERHGHNAADPSLLRGLVYDEDGNRFTPSHAVKKGKRYRYYVSQSAIGGNETASEGTLRIPARELENVVFGELRSFLLSADRIANAVGSGIDVGTMRRLIEVCRRFAESLNTERLTRASELIGEIIHRIVIQNAALEIRLKREVLFKSFFDTGFRHVERVLDQPGSEEHLVLRSAATLRRFRGEMRLIIAAPNEGSEARKPVPSLVKAIARGQDWVRAIIAGEYKDQRAIANALGVNERYVSNMISAAFLAPSIVEAIAEGREPMGSSISSLLEGLALSWHVQSKGLQERTRGAEPNGRTN